LEAALFVGRNFLEKGVLPLAGGYMNQDPLYVEAMGVIQDEEAQIFKEDNKK